MRIISLVPRDGQNVVLGRCGESQSTRVDFILRSWLTTYPEGNAALWVIPANSTSGYYAGTTFANGVLSWVLTASDLSATGAGKMELHFSATDGTRLKTCEFGTEVLPTLTDAQQATMPEYIAPWGAKVEAELAQMQAIETNVNTKASAAAASATAASGSASSAASSASAATLAANGASAAATSAVASANAAQTAKTNAETAATNATNAYNSASSAATAAYTASNTAQASASNATTSASNAQSAATSAADSAVAAAASAAEAAQIAGEIDEIKQVYWIEQISQQAYDDAVEARNKGYAVMFKAGIVYQGQTVVSANCVATYNEDAQHRAGYDRFTGTYAGGAVIETYHFWSDATFSSTKKNVLNKQDNTKNTDNYDEVGITNVLLKRNIDSTITSLKSDLTTKITKPTDAPSVGKVLRVKQVNDDGTFVCQWATGGSGGSTDVQINGTSIVQDGVANIPLAANNVFGVVSTVSSSFGIGVNSNGALYVSRASDAHIAGRACGYFPITSPSLNTAVKAALSDSKRIGTNNDGLSETEKGNAQEVIGIVTLTQEEYDLIETKGTNTIYMIVG